MKERKTIKRKREKNLKKIIAVVIIEITTLALIFGSIWFYIKWRNDSSAESAVTDKLVQVLDEKKDEKLSKEKLAAAAEQEKIKKEIKKREDLIAQADRLASGYDYDNAVKLIKSYQSEDGGYSVYKDLTAAVERLEKEKASLVLYGGSYTSITQINHIFFHILVADASKAFDGDNMDRGYNKYMTTISEFNKILQKMYDNGYVLVRMSDLVTKKTLKDGTTGYAENKIYLREGKKPFVLSEDDVCYYSYMAEDGFASRIVIGKDGKPTCEMKLDNGTTVTGAFDVVPILDAFIEKHPDFSYKGAKGLLALTGYEGILGYRTNDPNSPTYEKDREAVKKVVDVLKADGWEFGCHSWGHKDMQVESTALLKRDTNRWLKEVGPLVGPTDVYVFPFGNDIETTMGLYKSDKYQFLKKSGFNVFLGVFKQPWMHIKNDYVRMTRRPIDGQAMLEFPDRLSDLFDAKDIVDPERPAKNW